MNNLEVKKIVDGVYKFRPRNGGWGCRAFYTYPEYPMSHPSGNGHVIYVLGLPSVVWWRGSEYGRDGYGLAIKTGLGWEAWYDNRSRSEGLHVDIEKLMKAGIGGVFEAVVKADGLEITLLTKTAGEPQHLVVEKARPFSDEERDAITALLYGA